MNYEHVKEIASELKTLALRLDDALKENPSVYTHPWHEHNKKEKQFGYDKIDNDGGEF
tara:strand:+ start:1014 stop:1187 length:174 start_codon:yes stop_codon:yes gene_type:complete